MLDPIQRLRDKGTRIQHLNIHWMRWTKLLFFEKIDGRVHVVSDACPSNLPKEKWWRKPSIGPGNKYLSIFVFVWFLVQMLGLRHPFLFQHFLVGAHVSSFNFYFFMRMRPQESGTGKTFLHHSLYRPTTLSSFLLPHLLWCCGPVNQGMMKEK